MRRSITSTLAVTVLAAVCADAVCASVGALNAAENSVSVNATPAHEAAPALPNYAELWGPPVGSSAPAINAKDQTGQLRHLADLAGEAGVLLVLNRSVSW